MMHHTSLFYAPICRPDQANRATAVTSASFFGADDSTGCQRDKAGLRRSGKGAASVRPTSCATQASWHRTMKKTRTRWCIRLVIVVLPALSILNLQEARAASESDEIVAMDLLTVKEPRSQAESRLRVIRLTTRSGTTGYGD